MAVAAYRMSIAGEERDAVSGRTFESLDPYTGQPWASAPDGDAADVDAAVAAARARERRAPFTAADVIR